MPHVFTTKHDRTFSITLQRIRHTKNRTSQPPHPNKHENDNRNTIGYGRASNSTQPSQKICPQYKGNNLINNTTNTKKKRK